MFARTSNAIATDIVMHNVTINRMRHGYVCYELWQDAALQYLGVAKFNQICNLGDAAEIAAISSADQPVTIRIIAMGDQRDCLNHRAALLRQLATVPEANRRTRGRQIQCIEDGKTYPTLAAAGLAYDAAPSNISMHLRGRPGFRTVKGRTFRRV